MNFLEQLVAEWYGFKGYFVKTNMKYAKLDLGGYGGEMDVVAFHPSTKELVHIEASSDSYSWDKRKTHFLKKFNSANKHYKDIFDFEYSSLKQIALVGSANPRKEISFGQGIVIQSFVDFMHTIHNDLKKRGPWKEAVPESYPLLRAIQFSIWFGPK